jgi:aminoglycoside phosphotransferase (APT) family kinase protein
MASMAWKRSLETPPWDEKPVWIHGDLLKSNLLVQDGRLCAVIDFGGVGIGDPAADVVPAWSVFTKVGREIFRQALGVDDDTWNRARGYALHQALMIIPYYPQTNPEFVTMAKRTVEEILTELN